MKYLVLLLRALAEKFRIFACRLVWGFAPRQMGSGTELDLRGQVSVGRNLRLGKGASIIVEKGAFLRIGDDVFIGAGCFIKCYGGRLEIGNAVSLNPFSFINAAGGVHIGPATRVGAHSIVIASNHRFDVPGMLMKDQGTTMEGVHIGGNTWLGARVTVLDGVKIHDGCVIAAGAVVHKSLESRGVYAGVPAVFKRPIG